MFLSLCLDRVNWSVIDSVLKRWSWWLAYHWNSSEGATSGIKVSQVRLGIVRRSQEHLLWSAEIVRQSRS